ncbi:hypothetical protein ACFL4G_12320 [Thermodesulfobacteriota bacterium]
MKFVEQRDPAGNHTSLTPTRKSLVITVSSTIFTLLCFPGPVMGQSLFEDAIGGSVEEETAGIGGHLGPLSYELNGYVRGALWVGRVPDESDDEEAEVKAGYGEVSLKLRLRKGADGDGFAEFRISEGVADGEEETDLDLREAYINLYAGPFDIRFGHQIIVWGRADGINPTNNLTPYDRRVRSPDEDDYRLANFGLRAWYNIDDFRVEGVWMPTYAESHFPEFSLDGPIELGTPDYPGNGLSGGLGALRLNYEGPGFDASLSYLYGYAPFPGVEFRDLSIYLLKPPVIRLGMKAYRHHVIGFDFSTTMMERYGLRGEAAFRRPLGYEGREYIPDPDLQYVLGVDREFAGGDVMVIAQYIGRTTLDWEAITNPGLLDNGIRAWTPMSEIICLVRDEVALANRMINGQLEEVSHSAMTRVEWKLLQETLSLELLGVYNFTTEELLLRPKVSYDIVDALEVVAGAELLTGPDGTLYGMIERSQSAAYIQVKASF